MLGSRRGVLFGTRPQAGTRSTYTHRASRANYNGARESLATRDAACEDTPPLPGSVKARPREPCRRPFDELRPWTTRLSLGVTPPPPISVHLTRATRKSVRKAHSAGQAPVPRNLRPNRDEVARTAAWTKMSDREGGRMSAEAASRVARNRLGARERAQAASGLTGSQRVSEQPPKPTSSRLPG
jgi:hypothetical protein